jgi:cytochrome c5
MQILRLLASGVFVTSLWGCEGQIIGPPGPQPPARSSWLSYKYSASCRDCPELREPTEEIDYYCSINIQGGSASSYPVVDCANPQRASVSLADWKDSNGFSPSDAPFLAAQARAIYGNLGDLRIGRDMNCVKSGFNGNVACYVTNYGQPPFDPALGPNPLWLGANNFPQLGQAIEEAIVGHAPFATVAMVYNKDAAINHGGVNAVTFYAFKGDGSLLLAPALDFEGGKTSPRMCMACHGGEYDAATHSVTGAQFLPFDMFYFEHSSQAGYTLEDQQEAYRKLNNMVKDTLYDPTAAPGISDFISGTYHNAVETPGAAADGNYVPLGWSGQQETKLYNSVYRKYCRMCHMASRTRPFLTFEDFRQLTAAIENKVCQSTDMPNAQVPYVGFWQDPVAQGDLRDFLKAQGLTDLHGCK